MSSITVANTDRPEIVPRHPDFLSGGISKQLFFKGNAIFTSFACSMSAMFPEAEMGFIKSVRNFRDDVKNPELLKEIRGFIGQEGHHQKIHRDINRKITEECGLDVVRLEGIFDKFIREETEKMGKTKFGRQAWLAQTVCAEHFTAILGEYVLNHPEFLEGADHNITKLMEWHAIEEIEHKAVAFDVYKEVVDRPILLRLSMMLVTTFFILEIIYGQYKILRWAKIKPSWSDIKEAWRLNFGKSGLVRNVFIPWLTFFKPGFHPWQEDSRSLLENWKKANPEYIEAH